MVIVILAVSVLVTMIINKRAGKETKKSGKTCNLHSVCHCCISIISYSISYSQSCGSATLPVSTEMRSYGVLGGGVPQSIELKDNAAYSQGVTQNGNTID